VLSREKEGSVLCSFCGRENPEDYRFCGMCGAELEKPSPAAPPAAPDVFPPRRPAPEAYPPRQPEPAESPAPPPQRPEFTRSSISGPSFLGLDDQRSSTPEFSYLLEDEPGSGRGRVVVALLLIALLAGMGWWQVRRYGGTSAVIASLRRMVVRDWGHSVKTQGGEGVPADGLNRSKAATVENSTNEKASKPEEIEGEGKSLVPQPVVPKSGGAEASGNAAVQNPPRQAEQSAAKQPSLESGPSDSQGTSSGGSENGVSRPQSPLPSGADASAAQRQTAEADSRASESTRNSASDKNSEAEDDSDREARQRPSPASANTQPRSSADDPAVADAERYLYGRGVRQNCGRALSALRPAADASNPKARTLLGAMYATGHCVPRDLPSSYRWFTLALREDPNNVWVERNLQTVWNEMSASEKQRAMRMAK